MNPFVRKGGLVFVVLLLAGLYSLYAFNERRAEVFINENAHTPSQESNWQSYRDTKYGFRIQYPSTWDVVAGSDERLPSVTLYKKSEGELESPLGLTSNRTHITFYPRGLPLEDNFGLANDTQLTLPYSAEAYDYIVRDGFVWANYVQFDVKPSSWGPTGFLWAQRRIDGLAIDCIQAGVSVPDDECDPLFGDQIVYDGGVSSEDTEVIEKILMSFRFFEYHQDTTMASSSISVTTPREGVSIRNPLYVEGSAVPDWFFEGSFVVGIKDANGTVLAEGSAEAQKLTEDGLVPFTGSISYPKADTSVGSVYFEKANPHGLLPGGTSFEVDIFF